MFGPKMFSWYVIAVSVCDFWQNKGRSLENQPKRGHKDLGMVQNQQELGGCVRVNPFKIE